MSLVGELECRPPGVQSVSRHSLGPNCKVVTKLHTERQVKEGSGRHLSFCALQLIKFYLIITLRRNYVPPHLTLMEAETSVF